MLLPLADNSSACPKNFRQKFLRRQEHNLCPEKGETCSLWMIRPGTQSAARNQPWVQHPALLSGLVLWNPPNLPHFIRTHNQWCWRAGNDDPVTHRYRDWTTKAANFTVRVLRAGRIQCKIQQGCSSRIPWPWKSGRDLMPVEKEEWRFPWIPTGLTQLQPLPSNTDKSPFVEL